MRAIGSHVEPHGGGDSPPVPDPLQQPASLAACTATGKRGNRGGAISLPRDPQHARSLRRGGFWRRKVHGGVARQAKGGTPTCVSQPPVPGAKRASTAGVRSSHSRCASRRRRSANGARMASRIAARSSLDPCTRIALSPRASPNSTTIPHVSTRMTGGWLQTYPDRMIWPTGAQKMLFTALTAMLPRKMNETTPSAPIAAPASTSRTSASR